MKIVWIDLETTGLEAASHHVLEVAVVVTNEELVPVNVFQEVLPFSFRAHAPGIDPIVRDMHTRSGLWDECEAVSNAPRLPNYSTDGAIVSMLRQSGLEQGEAILGGSTINFDRAFLEVHFPRTFAFLHYRNFDTSTMKKALQEWAEITFPPSGDAHRALPDIMESIEVARIARNFMRGGGVR